MWLGVGASFSSTSYQEIYEEFPSQHLWIIATRKGKYARIEATSGNSTQNRFSNLTHHDETILSQSFEVFPSYYYKSSVSSIHVTSEYAIKASPYEKGRLFVQREYRFYQQASFLKL